MSAVAHLLRRRCSSILQKHSRISSLPFLIAPLESPQRAPPGAGHRKFTTTTGPGSSTVGNNPSRSSALKYTTAGAAVLLLSSAAWYVTRSSETPASQLTFPASLPGQDRGDESQHVINEKASIFVQSHHVQEEEGTKSDGVYEDTAGHERKAPEEGLGELVSDGVRALPERVEEITESVLNKASSEVSDAAKHIPPPLGPEEDIDRIPPPLGPEEDFDRIPPPVEEDDSISYEQQDHTRQSPDESLLDHDSALEEVDVETASSDSQVDSQVDWLADSQSTLASVVEAVKDKAFAAKDYLLNESTDRGEDHEGEGEAERDDGKDTFEVREMLRERYPDLFYPESDDDRDGARRADEDDEESRLLEISENELVGADRAVPSRLSPSYLVQKGHEDSLRRYSEKKREGEVPHFVERDETLTEDNGLTQDSSGNERRLAEESSKLVGVEVLVGAIQTAKQLQAEVDGRTFQEQLHLLREAHKREVDDFRSKLVAYEEGTENLETELQKEREQAAAALKLAESKAEERLQSELKQKDEAAFQERERLKMLEKAQATASLTHEKAVHLEDLHSVQLQVDALRTAFYARSEEARISHTAHKLAMGAFALEDALEKGQSVEKEANLLIASAGGSGVDPLVDAIVSSLPSETLTAGTGTRAQLHNKFSKLKGSLRELALMPAGGGGVFAHFFARVAANVKIQEHGSDSVGSEGIEVVIGKVEKLLADEKLVEAADVLETGVRGTAAESLAVEWAKQARNRAIIEQGLQALKAHVIAVASGLT